MISYKEYSRHRSSLQLTFVTAGRMVCLGPVISALLLHGCAACRRTSRCFSFTYLCCLQSHVSPFHCHVFCWAVSVLLSFVASDPYQLLGSSVSNANDHQFAKNRLVSRCEYGHSVRPVPNPWPLASKQMHCCSTELGPSCCSMPCDSCPHLSLAIPCMKLNMR